MVFCGIGWEAAHLRLPGPQRPVWQSSPVPYQDVMYGNQQLRVPTGSVPDPSAGVPGAFVTYLPPEEQV